MEPDMSQGVETPPSGQGASQDVGHAAGADGAPTHNAGAATGAARAPRITRALDPDEALNGDAPSAPPQVEQSAWLRDDDYWRKVTYISATGRRPGDRLATRPLPRPERFRARSSLHSAVILALVIVLIILIPVGVVMAGNAAAHFSIPTTIPGITQPTVTPTFTPAHSPTATPKKK